jgi:hypothetical protein
MAACFSTSSSRRRACAVAAALLPPAISTAHCSADAKNDDSDEGPPLSTPSEPFHAGEVAVQGRAGRERDAAFMGGLIAGARGVVPVYKLGLVNSQRVAYAATVGADGWPAALAMGGLESLSDHLHQHAITAK